MNDRLLSSGDTNRKNGSEEHTSELQSPCNLGCRLLPEKSNERGRRQSCPPAHARGAPDARAAALDTGRAGNSADRLFFFRRGGPHRAYHPPPPIFLSH